MSDAFETRLVSVALLERTARHLGVLERLVLSDDVRMLVAVTRAEVLDVINKNTDGRNISAEWLTV